MKKFLEKISWKTRKWNYTFHLFDLYLHDQTSTWGLNFLTFRNGVTVYSLFAFEFRLPNKTHVKSFTIDHWDILFIRNYLWNQYDELCDIDLWAPRSLSSWDLIKLKFLKRLFN